MTTLFGWGPMFGARGPSPFVLKTDIQLQMLGVSFDRRMADLETVKKHKAPYVEDDGEVIEDSTFIRAHFEKKLCRDLDAGLGETERGQAWALERLLEDRLNMIMIAERWLDDDNFFKGPAQFFARVPEAARAQVIDEVRTGLRATALAATRAASGCSWPPGISRRWPASWATSRSCLVRRRRRWTPSSMARSPPAARPSSTRRWSRWSTGTPTCAPISSGWRRASSTTSSGARRRSLTAGRGFPHCARPCAAPAPALRAGRRS